MKYYLTTDFQDRTYFATFDLAFETARAIWLNGEAIAVWICDKENNMVKRIRSSLDL